MATLASWPPWPPITEQGARSSGTTVFFQDAAQSHKVYLVNTGTVEVLTLVWGREVRDTTHVTSCRVLEHVRDGQLCPQVLHLRPHGLA